MRLQQDRTAKMAAQQPTLPRPIAGKLMFPLTHYLLTQKPQKIVHPMGVTTQKCLNTGANAIDKMFTGVPCILNKIKHNQQVPHKEGKKTSTWHLCSYW